MFKFRTFALISVAFILIVGLTLAAYGRLLTPQNSASQPAANSSLEYFDLAPVSAAPMAVHAVPLGERTLRTQLEQAYERHQDERVQYLLGILNGRFEHRCCGLPR